ncbi:phage minor head protein [Nonomuraea sp. NPDC026600]|uniref:phage minor head protein n=1 Tax=Nonomuraea sp. NPDC026600 TaxID=3155363 RepID=UPI00340DA687
MAVDPWLPARLRHDAELVRAEQNVEAAVLLAVEAWLQRVRELVLGEGDGGLSAAAPPPEPEQWPAAEPVWVLAMEQLVLPEIAELFSERFLAVARVAVDAAQPYVEAYIDEVASRLVLFPASAFEEIRPELAEAISEGETLDQIRSRIESILDFDTAADAPGTADHDRTKRLRAQIRAIERKLDPATGDQTLTGEQVSVLRATRRELYEELHESERRWQWKARRIARTETIGAYNGGAHEGAVFRSDVLGLDMAKRWLATLDTRVRPTHLAANGQLVRIADEFEVGDASLRFPGDPLGPGNEVINCRCTTLYEDVEDLDIDERTLLDSPPADAGISAAARPPERENPVTLTAASGGPYTGGMIALVPSPADIERLAVPNGELPEDLHLTLLFLGSGEDIADIAPYERQEIIARAAAVVGTLRDEGVTLPIEGNAFAISAFNPGSDDTAIVLGVGGEYLAALQRAIAYDVADVYAYPAQHMPWVAHVTLTYDDDLGQVAALADRTGPIVFDRLRVAFGEQVVDIPLTAEQAGDMAAMDALTASAWNELQAMPAMPAAWFAEPTPDELPPNSGGVHYADGRVYGWVAQRGVPHEAYPGQMLTIEALGPIDTTTFLRARMNLDDGSTVRVGAFTMNVGHHRDGAECETEMCQFDDTRTVAGVITVGMNEGGMWFSGAAAPWMSDWDRVVFAACQPSYHMRQNEFGQWSLRAVLSVPVPGHPSRLAAAAVVDRANLALTAAAAAGAPELPADVAEPGVDHEDHAARLARLDERITC